MTVLSIKFSDWPVILCILFIKSLCKLSISWFSLSYLFNVLIASIAFFIFIGVLIYFKVPKIIINLLDKRANTIRGEIDEASRLLEDAKSILAKSEREHKNNILKAEELIKSAETTSRKLLEDSKSEIKDAVARKLDMAKKQIEANEKNVLNSIRDEIIDAAFKIAEESIEKKLDKKTSEKITKESINEISTKLL